MAFRNVISQFVRSFAGASRTAVARRTLTSRSSEGTPYLRFAGPFIFGASAAIGGLLVVRNWDNNNLTLLGNVHAATKVGFRMKGSIVHVIVTREPNLNLY